PKNNIDAAPTVRIRVVSRSLLPDEIDRFANTGVAEFDPRNDDGVQLVADLRGTGDVLLKRVADLADILPVLSNRFFPAFFHLPELTGTGFVISLLIVAILSVINLLLAATRRGVVRIEGADLFVFLKRQIVTARIVVPVGFGQQLLNFFDLGDEFRSDRSIVITGMAKVSHQLLGFGTIRIVPLIKHFQRDRFSFAVLAFGNSLLGQN